MDLFTRSRPQDFFSTHVCDIIKSIMLQTILSSLDTYQLTDARNPTPLFFRVLEKDLHRVILT